MLMSFRAAQPRDGITQSTLTRVFISLTEEKAKFGDEKSENGKNPLRGKLEIDGFGNFSTVKYFFFIAQSKIFLDQGLLTRLLGMPRNGVSDFVINP